MPGHIYERHLSKVVFRHRQGLRTEEKAAVRHAKGIHYTASYIVDGILERTLKPLLKSCKSIEDIFRLRAVDPAWGSGSFLLAAYQMLHDEILSKAMPARQTADQHLARYTVTPRLKFTVKRPILDACLYGVDTDPRAI